MFTHDCMSVPDTFFKVVGQKGIPRGNSHCSHQIIIADHAADLGVFLPETPHLSQEHRNGLEH